MGKLDIALCVCVRVCVCVRERETHTHTHKQTAETEKVGGREKGIGRRGKKEGE